MVNVYKKNNKALVSVVKATKKVKDDVRKAVDLIGGFKKIIKKDDVVLLKPNFNTADPFPASSNPLFIKAIIELLYENGAAKVILGERSMYALSTRKVLEETGMLNIAEKAGADIILFDENSYKKIKINGRYMKKINITKIIDNVDKIVYSPCMKTHRMAAFTLSLKLTMGFVDKLTRFKMHAWKLQEKIADINLAVDPDLIIMDGRKCFVTQGPETGKIETPDKILASGDRIAVDVEALRILKSYPANNKLNKEVWDFPQIGHAAELGIGVKNESEIKVMK